MLKIQKLIKHYNNLKRQYFLAWQNINLYIEIYIYILKYYMCKKITFLKYKSLQGKDVNSI